MNGFASATFLLGTSLTAVAATLLAFGPTALLAVGAVLMAVGAVAGVADFVGTDDRYRVACPDCETKNWGERTRCRDCGAELP